MNTTELSLDEQSRIRREKLAALQRGGDDPFGVVKFKKTYHSTDILDNFDKLQGKTASIAGRIILSRHMGKASFCHILDGHGRIQIYVSINDLGEAEYEKFKNLDLGDIIGVTGSVFKTKTGEVSVHAATLVLLSKAISPLPDKHGGLADPELRFRHRHLDLIANPEVRETFKARSKIIKAVRDFLDNEGFLCVDTPILQNLAGGAEARPFVTHHNTMNMKMYLRIATELYLKRLIIGGFERVYEIGPVFRNEGISYKHNPEFTMLELYAAYLDYNDIANLTERMFTYVIKRVCASEQIEYQGSTIDFKTPWKRITMLDAVCGATGLDFHKLDEKQAIEEMKRLNLDLPKNKTWGELLYSCFEQCVEKTLVQPTFIMDYPIEISPLAKRKKSDPRLTERFEFFIAAREMGNAFSELNDPIDQRQRFEAQMREREKGNDEAHNLDEDFLAAMNYGMPPTGGLGVGIDRLVMLLTNSHSIREILLFPTMKNKG